MRPFTQLHAGLYLSLSNQYALYYTSPNSFSQRVNYIFDVIQNEGRFYRAIVNVNNCKFKLPDTTAGKFTKTAVLALPLILHGAYFIGDRFQISFLKTSSETIHNQIFEHFETINAIVFIACSLAAFYQGKYVYALSSSSTYFIFAAHHLKLIDDTTLCNAPYLQVIFFLLSIADDDEPCLDKGLLAFDMCTVLRNSVTNLESIKNSGDNYNGPACLRLLANYVIKQSEK